MSIIKHFLKYISNQFHQFVQLNTLKLLTKEENKEKGKRKETKKAKRKGRRKGKGIKERKGK